MSNSTVIDSESESVWCNICYMLKMWIFSYSYKTEDWILLFSDSFGVYLFLFQAEKMLLTVWFIIGVCV